MSLPSSYGMSSSKIALVPGDFILSRTPSSSMAFPGILIKPRSSNTLDVVSIFYLRCTQIDKLTERLQRRALKENRLDDANIDVIKNRLETYERETKPVLDFYGKQLVHEIDSDQLPAKVLFDILSDIVNV